MTGLPERLSNGIKELMKTFKTVSAFLILVCFFSCEGEDKYYKEVSLINCNECTPDEPLKATLDIKLEKLYRHSLSDPFIDITIFEGNLEDNIVYMSIQTTTTETTAVVPLSKKYTVTARYKINKHTYIAVNSITPHVKYDRHNCEEPCYYVADKSVNLRLKYLK